MGSVRAPTRCLLRNAGRKDETMNARDLINDLADALREAHQDEIDNEHGGDDSCSYCDLLKEADEFLKDESMTTLKEATAIEDRLRRHKNLMDMFIRNGYSQQEASRLAFELVTGKLELTQGKAK